MSDVFVGQILPLANNYAPTGFAFCNGQVLPISQNTALFSLIGTSFGGNGVSTFALPDLQGRVAVGSGQGPGLSDYLLGETGGAESSTLTASQMPQHTHSLTNGLTATARCSSALGNTSSPVGTVPAAEAGPAMTYTSGPANADMRSGTVVLSGAVADATGGAQAHTNIQPCVALNYCIALTGIFPSHP